MEYTMLNNGIKMPLLGFGVYMMTDPKECETSVLQALETGYRLLDTSSAYFNEEAVGRAIKESGIPRGNCSSRQSYGYRMRAMKMPKRGLKHPCKNWGLTILTSILFTSLAETVTAHGGP